MAKRQARRDGAAGGSADPRGRASEARPASVPEGKARRTGRSAATTAKRLAQVSEALESLQVPANADKPPVLFLRVLDDGFPSLGADLAHLAAYSDRRAVRQGALLMLFVAAMEEAVPARVRRRIGAAAAPLVLDALKDRAIDDERKLELGPLLEALGHHVEPDEYRGFFQDFEGAFKRATDASSDAIPDTLACVQHCLGEVGLEDMLEASEVATEEVEACIALSARLGDVTPGVGAMCLGVAALVARRLAETAWEAPFESALDALVRNRSGRAAWVLEALAAWPGLDADAKARVEERAQELRVAGIEPEPPRTGGFSHGFVTSADGTGAQSLVLLFRTLEGSLDALVFLLRDEVGIVDPTCVFGEGATVEEEVREHMGTSLSSAAVSLEIGRALVAHAIAIHEGRQVPAPAGYLLGMPFLGSRPLKAKARSPELGAYQLETYVPGPELVIGSQDVADIPAFGGLWFASDEAYDWVLEHAPRTPAARRKWATSAKALREFLAGPVQAEKARLLRRLAQNLEIESLAGRTQRPTNRAAARTWLCLRDDLVPFEEVPFVQALGRASLASITGNIALGFRRQAQVNAAEMQSVGSEPEDDEVADGLAGWR